MPRVARVAPGGLIYHVLNRGVGRMDLFKRPADFASFLQAIADTLRVVPMRICGYCLMSNHWHLVLWPRQDKELSRFMQRLTITHARRWIEHRDRVGYGSVYQGRYRSFPVQSDAHFTMLMRYVERNPRRAGMVRRAEAWRWSSLGQTADDGPVKGLKSPPAIIPLCPWPVPRRRDWIAYVNRSQRAAEEGAVRHSLRHSRPLGSAGWVSRMEKALSLTPLRPRGRPKGKTAKPKG